MRRVNFGTVGIVGLGVIGGSIGLRLREVGVAKRVIGFDLSEVRRVQATDRGLVDQTYETLNHLADADILVLAVPPNQVVPCLVEADVFCKVNCIVTDTASVKNHIVQWTDNYPLRFRPRYVGGHPMVTYLQDSAEEASADRFNGVPWLLTPTERTDRSAMEAVQALVQSLGAHPIPLSPEEHDRHSAILAHLPIALSGALALLAANLVHPEAAGPEWHDLTRHAGGDPEVCANTFANNRAEVVSALEDLEFHVRRLKEAVASEQYESLLEFFEASRRAAAEPRR